MKMNYNEKMDLDLLKKKVEQCMANVAEKKRDLNLTLVNLADFILLEMDSSNRDVIVIGHQLKNRKVAVEKAEKRYNKSVGDLRRAQNELKAKELELLSN